MPANRSPAPDFPYPMSNRFGERKDSPLKFVLVLMVVAFSSDMTVSATVLPPPLLKNEAARSLSWLIENLLPQDDIDEADETEESDEDEEADIPDFINAMDGSKLVFDSFIVVEIDVIIEFNGVAAMFDSATSKTNSNNSPSPVMGDH